MPDEATIPKNGEDTATGQAPPDSTPSMDSIPSTDSINSPQASSGQESSLDFTRDKSPQSEPATAPEPAAVESTTVPEPTPTETSADAEVSEAVPDSIDSPQAEPVPEPQAPPEPVQNNSPAPQATQSVAPPTSVITELLIKARAKIQDRRKKKLEKIMALFEKQGNGSTSSPQVSNNEVQKLLRVSDATATRYLDMLEKEGRLRQEGKTGKHVVYVKI